jgi:nucleoside-diphosphate-sugar epimerase
MQFVHVDDVVRAAMLAAATPGAAGAAYSLGNYPPILQRDWIDLLARAAGRSVKTVRVPRAKLEAAGGNAFAPPLYFGTYLDIPPITAKSHRVRDSLSLDLMPLDEGFRQTFEWYRKQSRPTPDFTWEDQFLGASADGRIGG